MIRSMFSGRKILVTGGTGSIGSELVRTLIPHEPEVIRVFSRDETKQFEMQFQLPKKGNIRFLIGDVRDRDRIQRAMEDIDYVFHGAAMKHVPACEFNPFEAVRTNVLGTQNCIDAALQEEVERFITISTDKAASPTNTMGATKLLAERLTVAANHYKGKRRTIFAGVRFGNVLGSRGSVVPLFLKQIQQGGPVTITNAEMTRFFMTIKEAVKLVLEACGKALGGEIFVLKMPSVRMQDLAEAMIELFAPLFGHSPKEIAIEEIGIRPGERIEEALMTEEEASLAEDLGNMWALKTHLVPCSDAHGAFTSTQQKLLSKEEIKEMLKRAEPISVSRVLA